MGDTVVKQSVTCSLFVISISSYKYHEICAVLACKYQKNFCQERIFHNFLLLWCRVFCVHMREIKNEWSITAVIKVCHVEIILGQLSSVHIFTTSFSKIHFNVLHDHAYISYMVPLKFLKQNCLHFLFSCVTIISSSMAYCPKNIK